MDTNIASYELDMERDKIANANFTKLAMSPRHEDREKAAEIGTEIIKERIREKAMPMSMFTWTTTTNDQLVPQLESEENMRYFDYEVDSPASLSVGLYSNPNNYTFAGRRGAMKFFKIMTPRMSKDTNEMRTYSYDIRKLFADNIVRDMAITLNMDWLTANQACLGGAPGSIPQWSHGPQWVEVQGTWGRETIPNIKSQMIDVQGDRGFEVKQLLVNTQTAIEPAKMGREESGGDLAQTMIQEGVSESSWGGLQWYITMNKFMVPTGTVWGFTDEKYYIRCSHLQETTMYIKSEYDMIEFVAMANLGMLIVNARNVIRTDLTKMPHRNAA
jgi:hypothetical protein